MRHHTRTPPVFGLILLFGLIASAAVIFGVVNATHTETHTGCLVTGKDRTSSTNADGNSTSDARIYTENCGTFQVADSLLSFTFSSADTYGSIAENSTYDFTTRGYRIPVFSNFPNIVEATKVK